MPACVHDSFLREIPEFILDSIIYCAQLTFKKNEKSCFILAKNLKFYEFRNKQMLNSLNFSETCLASLENQLQQYDGPRCKLKTEENGGTVEVPTCGLAFEKYIYRHFEISKLYLLLQCWDKLIVIEHNAAADDGCMTLAAEYENVETFKIVPNMLLKYQAEVKILLTDGSFVCTDFQEGNRMDAGAKNVNDAGADDDNELGSGKLTQKTEFKHLYERIRSAKAELQLHREITQKQFQNLYNEQNFGNNFVRSTKVEEKYMLSRCGDLWTRITATDELVLGLPLVNNCSPPNLTVLKNLQPIVNITQAAAAAAALHFEHRFYQLNRTFENLETLETVFQTHDSQFKDTMDSMAWQSTENNFPLAPNAYAVMLLKLKLSQLIFLEKPCQLFVRYEVENVREQPPLEETNQIQKFEQHLFVKTLDFQEILQQRLIHEISFKRETLHQDLLAVAIAFFELNLRCVFAAKCDFEKFKNMLSFKFKFDVIQRRTASSNISSVAETTAMNVDESLHDVENCNDGGIKLADTLFYNRLPNSSWFGSLALLRFANFKQNYFDQSDDDDAADFVTYWTFYNKDEEKTFLMLKLLFDDLLAVKCNIKDIKSVDHNLDSKNKLISFENALREELCAFSNLCQIDDSSSDAVSFQKNFFKLAKCQFRTDNIANDFVQQED